MCSRRFSGVSTTRMRTLLGRSRRWTRRSTSSSCRTCWGTAVVVAVEHADALRPGAVFVGVAVRQRDQPTPAGDRAVRHRADPAVVGWSMGAQQTYQWGALYPAMVERIAPIWRSARTSRHNFVFLEGVKAALTADDAWANGFYDTPPYKGLRAHGPGIRRVGGVAGLLPGGSLPGHRVLVPGGLPKLKPRWDVHSRGEKISLVLPVKPSNPRLENDPAGPLALHYLRISLWLWFSTGSMKC